MGMGFIELLMLIVMNGGGGTDLLDYVPTDNYWDRHSVLAVTPDAMVNVLNDEDADATDRLMAIRTLGELGDEASLAVLGPLVDSNEPFVGSYARRSVAWIQGEDPEPAAVIDAALLDADLALLPIDTQLVGQSRGLSASSGPIDLKAMLPDFAAAGGPPRDEMLKDLVDGLLEIIDQIGNIRLDAITLGMSFDEQRGEPDRVIIVARGRYDRDRVIRLLEEEGETDLFSIDDIEVAAMTEEWGEQFVMMMPSDERFVFMFTEDKNKEEDVALPVDEVAMLIQEGETEPMLGGVLLDELDEIDREHTPIWLAMEVPAMLKQNEAGEVFGAFDAMRFTGAVTGEGDLAVSAVARGGDAGAIEQTVGVIRGYIGEGIASIEEEMQFEPAMQPMFEPILGMLRSIEIEADGNTATGTMTVPNAQGGLFQMFFLGWAG